MNLGGTARRWMRLRGFLRKETLQIRRDPSSIALALVMPVVLLFLFGYGVSLDAENIPIAIVLEDGSPLARELAARFELSRYFRAERVATAEDASRRVAMREFDAFVRVQSDFAERLAAGDAAVQVIVDGVDANQARLIQGYARGVIASFAAQRAARGEVVPYAAVRLESRVHFNSNLRSTNFLVPGLVALVMTLTGVLLTALVVAREWERGTMEAILVTPLRPAEMLFGKIVPYFVLGLMGLALSVALGMLLFRVPLRGSLLALLALASLFMLASLGLGLLISAATRNQFIASQTSMLAGFLPAFFLSGLLFDLGSTPLVIRTISHIVPAKYFVAAVQTIFLAGDIWPLLLPNAAALGGMAVLLIGLTRRQLRGRLEENA